MSGPRLIVTAAEVVGEWSMLTPPLEFARTLRQLARQCIAAWVVVTIQAALEDHPIRRIHLRAWRVIP
jgi:hypothetical protein